MPNILLSGPAGSGKSQEARKLLEASTEPTVAADFQSIVAALLLQERGPDGKYPLRPEWVLPLAEYTRRSVITGARRAGIKIVATNSDGDPERREFLLRQLGEGAEEVVIDPGEEVVTERLSQTGTDGLPRLSTACKAAIGRWYQRIRGGRW